MTDSRVLKIQSITLGPGVEATDAELFYDGQANPEVWFRSPKAELSDPSDSVYVDADLGEPHIITEVVIWHCFPGKRYYSQSVEISKEGTFDGGDTSRVVAWETGAGVLGPAETAGGNRIVLENPARGRYVRTRCGRNDGNTGVHFVEMEVRGRSVDEDDCEGGADGEQDVDADDACASPAEGESMAPWAADEYGHAYWLNGWRKRGNEVSPNVLCFETGHFGLTIDVDDLTKVGFGEFDDESRVSYTDAVGMSNRERMAGLGEEGLIIEVQALGRTYRATTCLAGTSNTRAKARLWEAGRFAQNYELEGIVFKDGEGTELKCEKAKLFVGVWPRSFDLSLVLAPGEDWPDGANVKMELGEWSSHQAVVGTWAEGAGRRTALHCPVKEGGDDDGVTITMNGFKLPVIKGHKDLGKHSFKVKDVPRLFSGGYTDIRGYDKFNLTVRNSGEQGTYAMFLFEFFNPAQITGVVPMLCLPDGAPTGIPVQLSKNWHNKSMGAYVRAYSLLPAPPASSKEYVLQFVYGFYGKLPSASHANLSLVGWSNDGSNGRWEQLAIGCWGETHCIDAELSATGHNVITDVRALTVRAGAGGRVWRWTNAGWGGDWIDAYDGRNQRLLPRGVKVAYISQGPCLTEVRYGGYYGGAGGSVAASFRTTVRTLRTDDYARTFYELTYDFQDATSFGRDRPNGRDTCLFRVGGCGWEKLSSPRIAVGNSEDLIEEFEIPTDLEPGSFFKERFPLTGDGPWWVAYPGMEMKHQPEMGQAWKALIIQSYNVTAGGQEHANPYISLFVRHKNEDGRVPNVDTLVTPPEELDELSSGDSVSMGLYWITLPHNAVDYYGANEAMKQHLEEKPDSWETVLREVRGNNLEVEVAGGEVRHSYPLIIRSSGCSEIEASVSGGVGAVPVRFEGLDSTSYRLYRSTSDDGECTLSPADDSWQVDYDAETYTYSMTYNVLLDGMGSSVWVLKK